MPPYRPLFFVLAFACSIGPLFAEPRESPSVNRLTYLDTPNPFYPTAAFPKLTTPQWIGEPGVEVVVTLGIDDMSSHHRYEEYLRPILNRLRQIDGRAPVSIFCNALDPNEKHLQKWLQEGVNLEVHTLNHPCPILTRSDFAAARNSLLGGLDLLHRVPNNLPVAFRTPCCDSIDSASPRVFAELLTQTNSAGQFLRMDSSVALVLTTNDSSLPITTLLDAGGTNRFQRYLPFPAFTTTLENYPYPYVHSHGLWELPFVVPSDWESQNIQGNASPRFLEDWKAALDLIALKQGTFNTVFHPYAWSSPTQHVAFIDQAVEKFGTRLKFLQYREVEARLTQNLLSGHPMRHSDGGDNGVRLIDLNADGFLDVILGNERVQRTRVWDPTHSRWLDSRFPTVLADTSDTSRPPLDRETGVHFGIIHPTGEVSCWIRTETRSGAWTFRKTHWESDPALLNGLTLDGQPILSRSRGRDRGVRFRNVDGSGGCELLVSNESQNAVYTWSESDASWSRLPVRFPPDTSIVDSQGADNGLRFADLNGDGFEDIVFSNFSTYAVWLFVPEQFLGWNRGWNRKVMAGPQPPAPSHASPLPPFVRAGIHRNNGSWIHSRQFWWQNEDTASLPHHVDKRSFDELLVGVLPTPKSPQDSLASIRVPPGFQVDLVASEPLLQDPIAFDWSADGRLWVVEMRDYPLGIDGSGRPGGVVKVLEDTDGDGRPDRATEFLRALNFPTAITPWRRGVIVSAAPEIFYAEDTDGDGIADRRQTLFTGFVEGNQQHRVNGFSLGLDGWLYGANGDSGGDIQRVGRLDGQPVVPFPQPISLRGRDFRFHPDTGEFEAIEGQTQYGRWRDDWGRWFGNANYAWLWTYPLPSRYIARNPHLAVRDLRTHLANDPNGQRVYPISRPLQRPNVVGEDNTVTSANTPTPYRDSLFGPEFENSVFISEPTENLIHRERLNDPDGPLVSHRASTEQQSEFLASTDNWFRPIQTRTGPDGALWIVDMYRLSIEHPEWIPKDLQSRMNLRAGEDRGRMYRVYPTNAPPRAMPRLDRLDVAGWVQALESPNGWQRDTAMRWLLERRETSAVPGLERLVRESQQSKTRLQALATLNALGAVTPGVLLPALQDPHPVLRAHALIVAETALQQWPAAQRSELVQRLLETVRDPSPIVARQLAFLLGELREDRAGAALVQLTDREPADPLLTIAVLSSALPHLQTLLQTLAEVPQRPEGHRATERLLEPLVAFAVKSSNTTALQSGLIAVARLDPERDAPLQFRVLAGWLEGLDRRQDTSIDPSLLQKLAPIFAQAQRRALAPDTQEPVRLAALRLFGRGPQASAAADWKHLAEHLAARHSPAIHQAVLATMRRAPDPEGSIARDWIQQWPEFSPVLRNAMLDLLLSRPGWSTALLDAVESKQLTVADIGTTARRRLLDPLDASLRDRAKALFDVANPDRLAVIERYRAVRSHRGDPERGRILFQKNCAACHRLRSEGFDVGPNLAAVGDKSPEGLLPSILDPNRTIPEPFIAYTAITRDGNELTGIIAAESPNSLTLRMANGSEESLLRADLKSLGASRQSLMPEGFENSLDIPAMADLLAFIATSGPLPKSFPGNQPVTVTPEPSGILRLAASQAEIHGSTLVFEATYRNLGFWQSEDDHAVWTADIPKAGSYELWLEFASPSAPGTHSLRIEAGDTSMNFRIPSTGSWDVYQPTRAGRIQLPAGVQRIRVRAVPRVHGPILDLRELRLEPSRD